MQQSVFYSGTQLVEIVKKLNCKKILLVCDSSYEYLSLRRVIDTLPVPYIRFSDFTSNPRYEEVCQGVDLFLSGNCDVILAIGGGSTIDVAKCVKLFSKMDKRTNYLEQAYADSRTPLIAIPTTAGTGSEATKFAVIYYQEQKQSITHDSIIPDYVILEPDVLRTLPVYQKKCTMFDALCQGIESWWSINSNAESIIYSKKAIEIIIGCWHDYVTDYSREVAEQMLIAAHYAGRAINITQTTAPHAMSYKLTSLYKLPHGNAVAICLPHVWEYMNAHIDACADPRGAKHLRVVFNDIAAQMGCEDVDEAIRFFNQLLNTLKIDSPKLHDTAISDLVSSVNTSRLSNNPITLDTIALKHIYRQIMEV